MLGLPHTELVGVDRRGERATGGEIGQEHSLLRGENSRRLGHEMDAAEDDDIGVSLGRVAREAQRVSDEIGDVLDLWPLIVVRKNAGVANASEILDLGLE